MQIAKKFQELTKPEKYLPTLAGGMVGIVGGGMALDWVKGQVATQFPGNDLADWAAKAGVTAIALVGWMSYSPKGDIGKVANTALLGVAIAGGLSMVVKGLGWQPISIGRMGASPVARTGVRVVGKPVATPTYGQAMPTVPNAPAEIVQAF